ncbi:MAG TPA: primosomal protein N' [Candidatus Corynebacterium avicola]|uniref:Probable replication restart protein PriA n=1 Tax=Candidatus Corynebacterium avicola TaxID=2838527 RepID=A0A9D1RN40_9CORY|nr:primosomal protein N' [Candidatus Corynebacterium avicola]
MPHLDRLFDYAVPEKWDAEAQPGVKVRVRFAGRLVDALLVERRRTTDHVGDLSPLNRVISPVQIVPPHLWELVNRLANRYAGTRSDVIRAIIPSRHATAEKSGLFGGGASWEDLYGSLVARDDLVAAPREAAAEGWAAYRHADSFLAAVLAARPGKPARASWLWTPGEDWAARLAELAATVAWDGGGVLLVAPDQRDVDRITTALRQFLSAAQITELTSQVGPAARYRRHLAVLEGQGRVVVGTRSAASAPVQNLRLAVLVGDGEDALVDPRAPYLHARDVLRMRSELEECALLVGGAHRSAEIQQWVEQGFTPTLRPDPEVLRERMPWIHALDDIHDAHQNYSRMPSAGYKAIRRVLDAGHPVLIQVPRRGYAPSVACASCRTPARCRRCNGPLEIPRSGSGQPDDARDPAAASAPHCRWCGAMEGNFTCTSCGGHALRMTVIGQERTAEELGRAFPGVGVTVSGGGQVKDVIADKPRLVVATPGAEPAVEDGLYGAAVLMDSWLSLGRADLRATEQTLRQWMEASCLVAARENGGEVVLVAPTSEPTAQQLIRWDPEGAAANELATRVEARFPPAVTLIAADGTPSSLDQLQEAWTIPAPVVDDGGVEVLGPVELPAGVRRPAGLGDTEAELARRLIIRAPTGHQEEVGASLRAALSLRATRRQSDPLRVVVDPVRVG